MSISNPVGSSLFNVTRLFGCNETRTLSLALISLEHPEFFKRHELSRKVTPLHTPSVLRVKKSYAGPVPNIDSALVGFVNQVV